MAQVKDKSTEEAQAYISQKLEKLAHALYLITGSFSFDEPLRRSLRECGLTLLSAKRFVSGNMSNRNIGTQRVSDILEELVSLVSLARTSKLLSDANAEVLTTEITNLLEAGRDIYAEPLLSKGDLSVAADPHALEASVSPKTGNTAAEPSKTRKESTSSSGQARKSSSGQKPAGVSKAKKKRRNAIMEVLADKGEVGIKDIAKEIKGCSRKTIQRELSTLTDRGMVIKEGQRRWSTYRLTEKGRSTVGS